MVGPGEFWQRALDVLASDHGVASLGEAQCTAPLSLSEIAAKTGYDYKRLNAPRLISIDFVEELPSRLRMRWLYPVRLGQHNPRRGKGGQHTARFIMCRASEGFTREVLDLASLPYVKGVEREKREFKQPLWLRKAMDSSYAEALASAVTTHILKELVASSEKDLLFFNLFRTGKAVFRFKPYKSTGEYVYSGQVEVDLVAGDKEGQRLYAVEEKSLIRRGSSNRRRLFKYKIVFSAMAISALTGLEVTPAVSALIEHEGRRHVLIAILSPPADARRSYTVENLHVTKVIDVELT